MINVYLMCCYDINGNELYKIGFTRRNIQKRIKELKTGNASEIVLIDFFTSKWGTKIESILKRKYKKFNISGEWFNLPKEDILNFKENCNAIHENYELLNNNNTWFMDKAKDCNVL